MLAKLYFCTGFQISSRADMLVAETAVSCMIKKTAPRTSAVWGNEHLMILWIFLSSMHFLFLFPLLFSPPSLLALLLNFYSSSSLFQQNDINQSNWWWGVWEKQDLLHWNWGTPSGGDEWEERWGIGCVGLSPTCMHLSWSLMDAWHIPAHGISKYTFHYLCKRAESWLTDHELSHHPSLLTHSRSGVIR